MSALIAYLFAAIARSTPLLMGTTGEIMTEKGGSLNLGVEGMMAVGAITGYLAAVTFDNLLLGIVASFIGAALCGLLYAFLTVTLQSNQNVTGIALSPFGVALYKFIGNRMTQWDGGFPVASKFPHLTGVLRIQGIPVLRDIPYVGPLLFSHNLLVYFAVCVSVLCWLYIFKTKNGLKLRAVGENPSAADAAGVNVGRYRYIHDIIGGGICGIGGLYLGLVTNGSWNESWINGTGWIAVALVIFANWNPLIAIFGSFFFGMLQELTVRKGNLVEEFPGLSFLNDIPDDFYNLLPFAFTALVLILAGVLKRKNAEPSGLGLNYFREER